MKRQRDGGRLSGGDRRERGGLEEKKMEKKVFNKKEKEEEEDQEDQGRFQDFVFWGLTGRVFLFGGAKGGLSAEGAKLRLPKAKASHDQGSGGAS